jgi:hypothetical protein
MAMVKKVATIDIVDIDTEAVEKDDSFSAAYAFYIKLSGRPERQWLDIFNFEWRRSRYLMKREMTVIGDRLRLISGVDDNVQNHVAFAKELVKKTNERVEEDNRRIELMERRKSGMGEEVEKEKEEIRKKLRGISSS